MCKRKFRACHLCTFNVATIFFRGHPYTYGVRQYAITVCLYTLPECLLCPGYASANTTTIKGIPDSQTSSKEPGIRLVNMYHWEN